MTSAEDLLSREPTLLTPPALAEVGKPSSAFRDRRRGLVAIASEFELLYWPGRAVYAGHKLCYRLGLYEEALTKRLALLDACRFPIRAVAFHPRAPLAAVGTGSYDGGSLFEGALLLWNWETGAVRSLLAESREVVACRFDDDERLAILLRPRTEEEFDTHEPFDTYVGTVLDDLHARKTATGPTWVGDPRLEGLEPIAPSAMGFDPPQRSDAAEQDARAICAGVRGWSPRHRVWDVAFHDDVIVAVHDTCVVETWDRDELCTHSEEADTFGVQVLRVRERAVVHALKKWSYLEGGGSKSRLVGLDGETLREFDRAYAFSVDGSGRVLARDVGEVGLSEIPPPREDLVLGPDLTVKWKGDLGSYDCFNHFIRIDGDEALWFLRGYVGFDRRKRKTLCRLPTASKPEVVCPWDPRLASLLCGFAVRVGDGIVRCYERYDLNPTIEDLWLESRPLKGGSLLRRPAGDRWKRRVDGLATDMKRIAPDRVVYALTSGHLAILDTRSGEDVAQAEVRVNNAPTVPLSLAVRAGELLVGTICGNLLSYR